MEFRYKIPKHIVGYLENVEEDTLQQIMTFMFELAIQHRMLEYPRFSVEQDISELKESLSQLMSNNQSDMSKILDSINNLSSKLDKLNLVAVPSPHTVEAAVAIEPGTGEGLSLDFDMQELVSISEDEEVQFNDVELEDRFVQDMLK